MSRDPTGAGDGSLEFIIDRAPDPQDLALLEERLAEAAVAAAGVGEESEFAIVVRDRHEAIVAGASASVWGGCCQVHVVWVHDALRTRGLARSLMAEIESEARRQGCRLVMGLTYDVLTSGFYDRLGYRTVGSIDDCPSGTTTRWYKKDL